MKTKSEPFRTGIAGWVYPQWRKHFYPAGLVQKLELEYASERLKTIEINGTFYSLPTLESYERWFSETPDDFIFSVKGPQFITHIKRLSGVEGALANFFASGLFALKEKLGPIIWQLPPNFVYHPERLESFFKLLPTTNQKALLLAKKTDAHFKSKPYLKAIKAQLRYALEVRHPSFQESQKEFVALLKKYNIALVCTDPAETGPSFTEPTADFAYARLHGGSAKLPEGYNKLQLKKWADLARKWHAGAKQRDVFIYIVNEAKLNAPFNAMDLQKLLDT